jgi:hypothetical protein
MPDGRKIYARNALMRNASRRVSQEGYEENSNEEELPLSWWMHRTKVVLSTTTDPVSVMTGCTNYVSALYPMLSTPATLQTHRHPTAQRHRSRPTCRPCPQWQMTLLA